MSDKSRDEKLIFLFMQMIKPYFPWTPKRTGLRKALQKMMPTNLSKNRA